MGLSHDAGGIWTRQIRETGRLELKPARWPWALMVLGALMAVLAGLGMYGDAGTNDVQRVIGVIVIIGGIIGVPMSVRTFMRGKEPIVVDELGIQLPSRPLIPWFEVRGTNVYSYRGTQSVMIVVSDEFLSRFHSGTNPLIRFFSVAKGHHARSRDLPAHHYQGQCVRLRGVACESGRDPAAIRPGPVARPIRARPFARSAPPRHPR